MTHTVDIDCKYKITSITAKLHITGAADKAASLMG